MYEYLMNFNELVFYQFIMIDQLCSKWNIPIDIELQIKKKILQDVDCPLNILYE